MPGIMYGDSLPVHNELDAVAEGYINAIAKGKLTKLTPVWKKGLSAIYDTYLGACPENFTYNGKEYTPKTFAESLGLKAEDYVSLTSYTIILSILNSPSKFRITGVTVCHTTFRSMSSWL